ncbi:Hypothetical predicted protein [Pelobates cultripes]|uniref:Tubulin epsilon and delta complex protein 1 domain-containing protein n=1 Tax=Pelobates cultripes TaxID=61616 RepID=A0AAD1WYG9_PELCU|nr:Hypothetical predicted protein [Pelobates cultripes]
MRERTCGRVAQAHCAYTEGSVALRFEVLPASEFWKLLYCLLQQTYQRNNCSSLANENKGLENQAKYVKCVLRHQGYGRSAFYDLPCDGSEGSRELLLAFSWLLKKFKLLEKFLELIRVRLDDELDSCVDGQQVYSLQAPGLVERTPGACVPPILITSANTAPGKAKVRMRARAGRSWRWNASTGSDALHRA